MGGVKMRRRRIMTKIELGPDHNQNTPSGGFEKRETRFEAPEILKILSNFTLFLMLENVQLFACVRLMKKNF